MHFLDGVIALTAYASENTLDAPVTATVARLGEPLQTDVELLARLAQAGIVPGAKVTLEKSAGAVLAVGAPGAEIVLDLPEEVARHIFISNR